MIKYSIEYLNSVYNDAESLDKNVLLRIKQKIEWLSENFDFIPHEALKGKQFLERFKLRVGDYRVVYSLPKNKNTIIIEMIGHRSSIYKLQ